MARKKPLGYDRAFLDDVVAHPDDDTPRLVYADWLEDQGQDQRAELIRLQCRLATLDEYDPERLALEQRQDTLLFVHGNEWAALPVGMRQNPHAFRRGFLDRVSITATDLVKREATLFADAPIRDLQIRNVFGKMAAVAACPVLARVAALDFHDNYLTPDELRTLGKSPHLAALRGVSLLWTRPGKGHAAALATWPILPQLWRLELGTNLGQPSGDVLARLAPQLPSLRQLTYWDARPAGLAALRAVAPALAHVEIHGGYTTPEMLAVLAAFPALTSLRLFGYGDADALSSAALIERLLALDLGGARLSLAALAALVRGPQLARLRRLSFGRSNLGTEGANLLATAPLDCLFRLDAENAGLGPEAIRCFAAAPSLAGLRWLNVSHNPLGDDGAAALALSPQLRGLIYLDLRRCTIGPDGAAALAASPNLANLRCLRLTGNPLGDAGVAALAASPYLGELRVLELDEVGLGADGVRALARSGLGNLTSLDIVAYRPPYPDAALVEFADPTRLPRLLKLGRPLH